LIREELFSNEAQMDDFCRENGFVTWFRTSAKENTNIEESFQCLINEVKYFPSISFNFNSVIFFRKIMKDPQHLSQQVEGNNSRSN
jgi:GTPase SAR1 family protein